MRVELLIANGTLVTGDAIFPADLGIDGEHITAVAAPGHLDGETTIDASGLYVLPGLIDGHVHFREPGLDYKEDFLSGSRAAVMGGVTTVLDMPNTRPPTSTAALVHAKRSLAEGRAYCDFGFYGLLAQDNLGELAGMVEAGVVGFKCFLGQTTGDLPPPDDGTLVDALFEVARLGVRTAFHAENDAIVRHRTRALRDSGRADALAHTDSRPIVAEVEAIQRVGLFAAHTGARVHILHLSSREGLEGVESWRGRGADITCEATPHHCFLTADDVRRLGSIARINPPIRDASHGVALLRGLATGQITCIATDHSPHTPEEKVQQNIWDAVSGFPCVETSLRLFLTHAVHAGHLTLPQLVRATSAGPARTWGLYPRKGTLRVGADADLILVDLERPGVIEATRLHGKNNLSPYEGWRTRGAAVATILRGGLVMRDGELLGEPRGRHLTV